MYHLYLYIYAKFIILTVLDVEVEYITSEEDTLQYRQRAQQAFFDSVLELLLDDTDEFYEVIAEDAECDCIDNLEDHIAILIEEQFGSISRRRNLLQTSYLMVITATTDKELLNKELQLLFDDKRFKTILGINMRKFDSSFEATQITMPSSESDSNADDEIITYITIVVVCILGVVLIIAIIGTIQMYAYDVTIYVTGILLFGLYTWYAIYCIILSYCLEIISIYNKNNDNNINMSNNKKTKSIIIGHVQGFL